MLKPAYTVLIVSFSAVPPPAPVNNQPTSQDESLYDVVSTGTLGRGAKSNHVKFKIAYKSPHRPIQKKIFEAPLDIQFPRMNMDR